MTTPIIKPSKKINLLTSIWIMPVLALSISLWLMYQYYANLGEEVVIYFDESAGLKAGRSQVRYKDIAIGKVKSIKLDEEQVAVIVNINQSVKKLVHKNTKFWIVKPEISISGISGLDAFFSGTYIDMYAPGTGEFVNTFIGSKTSYYDQNNVNLFHLRANSEQKVFKGMNIYYNSITIGEVERVNISPDGTKTDVLIRINNQYLPYVHQLSRFWIEDFISIDFSRAKLAIKVAPLKHLIGGGIILSTLEKGHNMSVPEDFVFTLYNSKAHSDNHTHQLGRGGDFMQPFKILIPQSMANLRVGSAVTYQQYEVGKVSAIEAFYDQATQQINSMIDLEVDISVFSDKKSNLAQSNTQFYQALNQGLYAMITTSNLITGALMVELKFGNASEFEPKKIAGKLLLPSIKEEKNIIADIADILANIKTLSAQDEFHKIPDELNTTLGKLQTTLDSAQVVLSQDKFNTLGEQIAQTLKSINSTAIELKQFIKLLNRKPNALIFGDQE